MFEKRNAGLRGWLSLGWCLLILQTSAAEPFRVSLEPGTLTVPPAVAVKGGRYDLVVHLHGATKVVEENLADAYPEAVWVTLTLPGLSSVYRRHFRDPNVFTSLLEEVEHHLAARSLVQEPELRHLTVTSFSAGFGGVRELLKQPRNWARIDSLVMADSLYAGFRGDVTDRVVNPEHLKPFVGFARLAADGQKRMLLSHTELHTPDYASTGETADYLVRALGGPRHLGRTVHVDGLVERSRYSNGNFLVIGFEGETGESHMMHLRHLGIFLREVKAMELKK